MSTKMSIVAAAFAAGMLAQPATASASTVPNAAAGPAVKSEAAKLLPSAAAVERFKQLADGTQVTVHAEATFRRIIFMRVIFRRVIRV